MQRSSVALLPALVCALVLLGCASGRPSNGDVDAPPGGGGDGPKSPDAALCGGDLLPCEAIYVAKNGSDGAAGTKQAPVRTIAVAIAKAGQSNPLKVVFVGAGTYNESITMSPGVSVFGGFDETWEQNVAVTTEIVGDSPAVTFEGITVPTSFPGTVEKKLRAQVTMHGVAQALEIPVKIVFESDKKARATSSFTLSLDAFKIERPALMFVKIDDALTIDADVVLTR